MELYKARNYSEALPLAERASELSESALGPEHPDVAESLNNLARVYGAMGNFTDAEPLYLRVLAIREKALGPEHLDLAELLNNLAGVYRAMGPLTKAEPLYERALTIQEKALGLEHPDVAQSLNLLAMLNVLMGNSAKAELLYQRSLVITEKAMGPEHPDVARSLINLAHLYDSSRQYAKAEPLYQRSLVITEKARGPEHPDVAWSLINLAHLYDSTRQYAKAEPLYQRSLVITEKARGPEHLDVVWWLDQLAKHYRSMGAWAKAEPLYLRVLSIQEKALGPEHSDVESSLINLALLYDSTGQHAKAEALNKRALTIREKNLGASTTLKALSLHNQALMSAREGGHQHAADLFVKIFGIEEGLIQNNFPFLSEGGKLRFMQVFSKNLDVYLSLVHQHLGPDRLAVHAALDVLLRRKGVVFEAQSRLQEARQGQLAGKAHQDWQRLSALRSEYARLALHKPDNMTSQFYREKLASFQGDIDAVERRLAKESGLVAEELAQRRVTVEQVAKQLPTDAVLVEFVRIRDYNFTKGEKGYVKPKPSSRYLAFVLTAAGNVTLVDLGEVEAIDRQADRTLEDIKVAMMTLRKDHLVKSQESLAQLSTLVWKPLASLLGQTNRLIVSPDGQLNLVPFAALMEETGQPLVERYHLAYVSSGRELITTDAIFTPDTELLLVANPAYDQTVPKASHPGPALRSRDFRGHFDPLPGTEREAREIPPLVSGPPAKKRVVIGPSATERVVKAARSPRILHLATHGFFLQDKLVPLETSLRGVRIEIGAPLAAEPRNESFPQRYENPLLRSGLVFAGANHAGESTDDEDGILTALEITGMNLHGTELVVLSACETAVGMVHTGEGVFGLRRAFALAGARNLLMSLWSVDDEVTADQMKAFYQNLRTLPPADALRQAQRETIRRLKARDGVANPGFWAPFILQGGHAFGP